MIATLPMSNQTSQAFAVVEIQPGIDGIGITRFQQPVPGDGMSHLAVGHLQQRTAPFAHIGSGMMISLIFEFLALAVGQF
jgi:hypothetical protein